MEKALFWDFDGTLARSPSWSGSILQAIDAVAPGSGISINDIRLRMRGAYPWDDPALGLHSPVGEAWWDHMLSRIEAAYRLLGVGGEEARLAGERVREMIFCSGHYSLYEDTVSTLSACVKRGYKNFILSNNYPELPRTVERLHIAQYFSGYVVSALIGYDKPHAEFFRYALRQADGLEVSLMIGDNVGADIAGGKRAGIKTVLVHSESVEEQAQADYAFSCLADILKILK